MRRQLCLPTPCDGLKHIAMTQTMHGRSPRNARTPHIAVWKLKPKVKMAKVRCRVNELDFSLFRSAGEEQTRRKSQRRAQIYEKLPKTTNVFIHDSYGGERVFHHVFSAVCVCVRACECVHILIIIFFFSFRSMRHLLIVY